MVDLPGQLAHIREEVDSAIDEVLASGRFIKGPEVSAFESNLKSYLGTRNVITCANGTDALQIALMALDLKPSDEVIVPAFTYAATAEVVGLLGYRCVMVDVDPKTFNMDLQSLEKAITPRTKAMIPVHLYGLTSQMFEIMEIAEAHGLYVIEDNAQAIGSDYTFPDDQTKKAGTIGHIGCTSFFPTKNLGCFGDGGALYTDDEALGARIRMIASHGQSKKYHHEILGVNSRLDTLQAAILDVKLKYLDHYIAARQRAAGSYDTLLNTCDQVILPSRVDYSTHVFHQYTIRVRNGKRDDLKSYLQGQGIPSMIYYPLPLYRQNAYKAWWDQKKNLPVTEILCQEVLSLPMHTELTEKQLDYICGHVRNFFDS